ncbi:MAG: hypothetical protein WBX38_17515, partial [Candidatus Sulfotelmatobacter sp.]
MRKTISRIVVVLVTLALATAVASATTYNESISAGLGTLKYTATVTTLTCQEFIGHQLRTNTYYQTSYASFSYVASGVTTALTGSVTSTDDAGYIPGQPCPESKFPSVTLTGGGVEVAFTPSSEYGGAAVYGGFINPKFLITGVMYAPPGSKSSVTYSANTVVGNSTSVKTSFSSTVTESVAISESGAIPGFLSGKITTTESDSYTEEQDTTNSIAMSQTTSDSTGLAGYSDPVNGVNHDYDYIFVWLNPVVTFTVSTASGKTQVQWTAFGYDLSDTGAYPEMDEIGIQLGCLNGDFYSQYENGSNTQNWPTCEDVINNNFARSWALTNTDGTNPALTPTLAKSSPPYDFCTQTGTDLYAICQADPFSNPSYALQFASGSNTTKDGRFTACSNSLCNSTIEYEPNVTKGYSQGYSTTTSTNQNVQYTYTSSYSVESAFTGGSTSFGETIGATFTNTNSFSSSDEFSQATNNSDGQTSAFSIV